MDSVVVFSAYLEAPDSILMKNVNQFVIEFDDFHDFPYFPTWGKEPWGVPGIEHGPLIPSFHIFPRGSPVS